MLILHRITHEQDWINCDASGKILKYGDYYFQDDETGKIISADYYYQLKEKKKRDEFDYTILNNAQNQKDYQEQLKKAEQDYITATVLGEPVFNKFAQNYEREMKK